MFGTQSLNMKYSVGEWAFCMRSAAFPSAIACARERALLCLCNPYPEKKTLEVLR